jgi:hypothetical protein
MNTTNSTSPAYPTFPITNGLTNQPVIFTGMTKQEQLAAQIFLFLFKEMHNEFSKCMLNANEMQTMMKKSKDLSYDVANFFFSESEKTIIHEQ